MAGDENPDGSHKNLIFSTPFDLPVGQPLSGYRVTEVRPLYSSMRVHKVCKYATSLTPWLPGSPTLRLVDVAERMMILLDSAIVCPWPPAAPTLFIQAQELAVKSFRKVCRTFMAQGDNHIK
jgi:hypothetical protein